MPAVADICGARTWPRRITIATSSLLMLRLFQLRLLPREIAKVRGSGSDSASSIARQWLAPSARRSSLQRTLRSVGGHGWPSALSPVTVRVILIMAGLPSLARLASGTARPAASRPRRVVSEEFMCTISLLRSRGGLATWGEAGLNKTCRQFYLPGPAQVRAGSVLLSDRRRWLSSPIHACNSGRVKHGQAVAPCRVRFRCDE
jgi:hypothetical protein